MTRLLRIAIADDHPIYRTGLRHLLEEQVGWNIVGEASDGQGAVDLVHEYKPDVLLLDLMMPNLDGLGAARIIHREDPSVEMLMLSVHDDPCDAMNSLAAGARGYLSKTESPRMVVAAVEAVANHRLFMSGCAAQIPSPPIGENGRAMTPGSPRLTPREREVLTLLADGKTNKEVASHLGISAKTADVHRTNIMRRLNAHCVSELVRYAIRERLVEA